MKESCEEQLGIDFGHKPYAGSGDGNSLDDKKNLLKSPQF